ncbi:hypothetical protein QOZ80_4BG0340850 [Eleusine coracana subsp. coracana]|nr:hypothetical protein QOZ80_4BG0340850 [Eleusine coracana subsp. coracana]
MEAYAALKGLEKAAYWNMPHIILETDAANLGCAITSAAWDNSPGGSIFRHSRDLLAHVYNSISVSVCPRQYNRVAASLAGHGVSALPTGEPMYWCEAPSFVVDLVSDDLPEVCS